MSVEQMVSGWRDEVGAQEREKRLEGKARAELWRLRTQARDTQHKTQPANPPPLLFL